MYLKIVNQGFQRLQKKQFNRASAGKNVSAHFIFDLCKIYKQLIFNELDLLSDAQDCLVSAMCVSP